MSARTVSTSLSISSLSDDQNHSAHLIAEYLFLEALSIEIATQTNKYARKHIEATPDNNWYPTNPEEIKAFIAQYWYSNCHGCSTTPCPRHVLVQR
jgi:hypothetical protein